MLDGGLPALAHFSATKLGYAENIVFEQLELTLQKGEITMFCGPNGCGKSTALKALRRLIGPKAGSVIFDGKPIEQLSNKELAKAMAMLTQAPAAPGELVVSQLVTMGRFAHRQYFGGLSAADNTAITFALEACDLSLLADTPIGALSGGQLQRAWLAMIIAQNAPTILLDEPTNHLDITHQIETLELIKRLNEDQQKTIVVVMHDLNLAARYADRMIMFKDGKIHADGAPDEVMVEDTIGAIFSINCRIVSDPVFAKPMCIPYPSSKTPTGNKTSDEAQRLGQEA